MKVDIKVDYAKQRLKEYPSLADQMDAYWKGGAAEEDMRAKVLAVKAKYPEEVIAAPMLPKDNI